MGAMILSGFIIVLALLMTLARMDLLKFLGYSTIVDILFTLLMFTMFHGTFSGIVASAFAGVFMTIMLYVLRGTIGCKKLKFRRCKYGLIKLTWVYYGPENYRGKFSRAKGA